MGSQAAAVETVRRLATWIEPPLPRASDLAASRLRPGRARAGRGWIASHERRGEDVASCLCNFMNRFVEGIGLTPIPDRFEMEGRLIEGGSYKGMLDAFGLV